MDELLFATLVSIEILAFNDFKFFFAFYFWFEELHRWGEEEKAN